MAEKKGLGRGLAALIGSDILPEAVSEEARAFPTRAERVIPVENIEPNPDQPRRHFDRSELEQLAQSIASKGIIQPVILRPRGDNRYQIVAGERRWRAAQIARIHSIPALIGDYDDEEVLEISIIENVQRTELNVVEEAQSYRQLIDRFGHTQEKLAGALGKSRSHIANQLRLLNLPEAALDMLRRGQLTAGHARTLLSAQHPMQLARQIVNKGLSVRQAEALARAPTVAKTGPSRRSRHKDADTLALENDLSATLHMRVTIDHREDGDGGTITVRYRNLDDLDAICQALSQAKQLAR